MIAKLLSEALVTLKTVAAEIEVPLDELTPEQLEKHQRKSFSNGCLANERLQDKKANKSQQPIE